MQLISIVIFLFSLLVQQLLRRKLAHFASIPLKSGLTGAEIAAKMLRDYGIYDVKVIITQGHLTDHYNPLDKTVSLSAGVYHGSHAGAAAVAAHECGHAVQHAKGYAFLQMRSAMVPFLSFTSRYMMLMIMIGILMIKTTLLPLEIGIGLFALTTLFSLITLPVEFDASRRALAWIDRQGIVSSQEHSQAKEALRWAAMTYVLAALGSLAELWRLVTILLSHNRRREEGAY
jgi:Zn-dependent membrane protease YugP